MMDRAALRLILLGVFLISATSDPFKKKQNVDIYSFYINSTVTSRYATTVITSRVANTLNESQEIQFEVKIPKNAFISKFRMVLLKGQEKEDEKKEALKLSLKYQFVTPLTSMVVTKPQEGEVEVADKPKEGEAPPRPPVHPRPVPNGPFGPPGFSLYQYQPRQPSPAAAFPVLRGSGGYSGSHSVLSGMAFFLSFFSYVGGRYRSERILARPSYPVAEDFDPRGRLISAPAVHSSRFLVSVVGQSMPLCFDVTVPHKLRLFQDSASEFSVNGECMTGQSGFHNIAFHYKTNHHLTISTTSIRYHDGQNHVEFLWGQELTQNKTEEVMVKDYRFSSAPAVGCWLVPFQAVVQRELSDFTVTEL
ncbi:hypothetical protein cypCar_00017915 [Cyprinus carpio]|nr:hypothetical protein cypCar_00017915 [Cyprinus carpio]